MFFEVARQDLKNRYAHENGKQERKKPLPTRCAWSSSLSTYQVNVTETMIGQERKKEEERN